MTDYSRLLRTGLCYWLITAFSLTSSTASVILDWNKLMLAGVRTESTSPTTSSRNLAMMHTAIYDAVNSVARTHQPYRFQLTPLAQAAPDAAAVAAAYRVMVTLYPSFKAAADDLLASFVSSASSVEALTNGLQLGDAVGMLVLDSRSEDGANTEVPYIPNNAPGHWQRTPPFFRPPLTPHWRYVTPFCIPNADAFVPPPPPALDSAEYAAAVNQVKQIGGKGSAVRTPEQSEIAIFWSDFSYTAMPPGHWHEIAASIAENSGLTLEATARMFALVSVVQADAAIVCWETKYRFNLWRPITAIQRADEDGNPATQKDAAWDHFLASPPFPAYTSGHSTFSKGAAQILTRFYGTDAVTFSALSDSLPGVVRNFSSFATCAEEIGMSRIYGGIHYSFDNEAGKQSGGKIADYIADNFLLANDRLPFLRLETSAAGAMALRMHGHFGRSVVLEVSSDLKNWQSLNTNAVTSGGVILAEAGAAPARFFRVREQ